ncbi:hypothetical protein SELMODRAFT_447184 [Selaginella moellendorffii]|uniref:RING-type E3 ubiquitin transferase n=1 Tax=Selaginella moellendorffii TaxID=88036 RepID=D8SXH0_SELML|nr:E3 ubiquitin-protein ligase Topors [Selaginella moellendorffii]EFJ10885.1 hypothetical protein SELMODRAFT_447184 [Selaginella moellendorffii]|eukprot:XP_002988093.1 E3 ubiquitin-protein ligase Topors [Selaginella moellendorffii]
MNPVERSNSNTATTSSSGNFVWLPSLQVWSFRPAETSISSQHGGAIMPGLARACSQQHQQHEITFELRQPSRLPMHREDEEKGAEAEHVCPICLGAIEESKNASLWWCMHSFCVGCIEEWSKVRRSCPLCKAEFTGWYHTIKGQKRVERILPPLDYRPSLDYRLSTAEDYRLSLSDFRISTSDYRLSTDGRPSSVLPERRTSTSRNQARLEREVVRSTMTFRSRLRLQQLMQSRVSRSYRRSIPLPRQRCFISPAERERLTAEVLTERALSWRTSIYRKGLRAVPLNVKKRMELRPYDLDAKTRAERRLRPWITRELKAILGDTDHSVLEQLVLSHWFSYRIDAIEGSDDPPEGPRKSSSQSSSEAVSQLERFLGSNASTFWHELRCYAECPYTMETYDSIVVYVKGERQLL